MKPHPRERVVREATIDLQLRMSAWLRDHQLTTVEELSIINAVLSGAIGGTLKYCIRRERHGDDQTPGGIETHDESESRGKHRDD